MRNKSFNLPCRLSARCGCAPRFGGQKFSGGRIYLVAAGKAAWQMAQCAAQMLGDRLTAGVVVTNMTTAREISPIVPSMRVAILFPMKIPSVVPGPLWIWLRTSPRRTQSSSWSPERFCSVRVPLVSGDDLARLTKDLLACGADIVEMNTLRKRLSAVKGGKFAQLCAPAQVYAIVLSDILGDPLDMIASGPAYPDSSTKEDAWAIAEKYQLSLTDEMKKLLDVETPKQLDNVETVITGSVRELCTAAAQACQELGYQPPSSPIASAARPRRPVPSWPPSPRAMKTPTTPWPSCGR